MFCTRCGERLDEGAKFCTACGASVGGPSDATAPSPAQAASNVGTRGATGTDQAHAPVGGNQRGLVPVVAIAAVIALLIAAAVAAFAIARPFDAPGASDAGGAQASSGAANNSSSPQSSQGSVAQDTSSSSGLTAGEGQDAPQAASNQEPSQVASEQGALDMEVEDSAPGAASGASASSGSETKALQVAITSARASTALPTGGVNTSNYSARSAIDGKANTCWAEGASGNGVGESITLSGKGEQVFSGFYIRNGYQKSKTLYYKNGRPKTLKVYVDGRLVDTVRLKDSGLKRQKFTFDEPVTGEEIQFKIESVYKGTKYDDCCISEIDVF